MGPPGQQTEVRNDFRRVCNFHFSLHLTRTFGADIVAQSASWSYKSVCHTLPSQPFCILKDGHGLKAANTGCRAAASSSPAGREPLSLSLSIRFLPVSVSCARRSVGRAGAAKLASSLDFLVYNNNCRSQQQGLGSISSKGPIVVARPGHVFHFKFLFCALLLVCCCYCLLHLTWTFGARLSKSWQRTTSRNLEKISLHAETFRRWPGQKQSTPQHTPPTHNGTHPYGWLMAPQPHPCASSHAHETTLKQIHVGLWLWHWPVSLMPEVIVLFGTYMPNEILQIYLQDIQPIKLTNSMLSA